jgi:hypothetical protein
MAARMAQAEDIPNTEEVADMAEVTRGIPPLPAIPNTTAVTGAVQAILVAPMEASEDMKDVIETVPAGAGAEHYLKPTLYCSFC